MLNFLEKHRIICFVFLIFIAIEIFYFSSISTSSSVGGLSITPIIYHLVVFFLFSIFLLAFLKGKAKMKLWQIGLGSIISMIYAFLDEFHQSFVSGRNASIEDIILDNIGILFAILIYFIYQLNYKSSQYSLRVYGEECESEYV